MSRIWSKIRNFAKTAAIVCTMAAGTHASISASQVVVDDALESGVSSTGISVVSGQTRQQNFFSVSKKNAHRSDARESRLRSRLPVISAIIENSASATIEAANTVVSSIEGAALFAQSIVPKVGASNETLASSGKIARSVSRKRVVASAVKNNSEKKAAFYKSHQNSHPGKDLLGQGRGEGISYGNATLEHKQTLDGPVLLGGNLQSSVGLFLMQRHSFAGAASQNYDCCKIDLQGRADGLPCSPLLLGPVGNEYSLGNSRNLLHLAMPSEDLSYSAHFLGSRLVESAGDHNAVDRSAPLTGAGARERDRASKASFSYTTSLVLVVSGVSVASLAATTVYHVDRDPDGGSGYYTVVQMLELDKFEHARLSYKPMPGFYSSVLAELRLPVRILPFAYTGKSAAQNLV